MYQYSSRIRVTVLPAVLSLGLLAGCGDESANNTPPALVAAQPATNTIESTEARADESTPFAVGSTTVFIHDQSRPFDSVAGVDTGVRTLITELWYPVAHSAIGANSKVATYGDYVFGNRAVHRQMMTQTTFFHLTPGSVREGVDQAQIDRAIETLFHRARGSYTDAPPADNGRWPVVVMTHGDAGSRYNMQTVSEYLAAHGYLVIAPEHTGNSPYSMTGADPALSAHGGDPQLKEQMAEVLPLLDENGTYGSAKTFGQTYIALSGGFTPEGVARLDSSLLERVNDLRAALDTLEDMDRAGPFAGRVDLSRIGLMGRSFGGVTTLAGLALENRIQAGFAVVAPPLPDLRAAMPPDILVQPPAESVLLAAGGEAVLGRLHKPTLLLVGGEDRLILGLASKMATAFGSTPPSPDDPYPALQAAFDNADVPAVYAQVQNTNHGSFGVAGPYWWPQLKPDTFAPFFDPEKEYRLLPAATAHRIQREMALAFFNFQLKGDREAFERLQANPWAEHGTRIQARGIDTP